MALQNAFDGLLIALRRLRECVADLRNTIVEDRPVDAGAFTDIRTDAKAFTDILSDAVDDTLGRLEEAAAAAELAARATATQGNAAATRRSLIACEASFAEADLRLEGQLARYDRIAEVERLGRTRGGEWRGWARSVKNGLEVCGPPLREARYALVACWRELAERGGPGVNVQATNIGQQITLAEGHESMAAGVT